MKSIKLSIAMLCVVGTIQSNGNTHSPNGSIILNAMGGQVNPNAISTRMKVLKSVFKLPKKALIPGLIIAAAYGECMKKRQNPTDDISTKNVIDESYYLLENTWLAVSTFAKYSTAQVTPYLPAAVLAIFEKNQQTQSSTSANAMVSTPCGTNVQIPTSLTDTPNNNSENPTEESKE